MQYISQMRRGVKDDATGRNDWAEYETLPNHMLPLEGELVLEYDNGIPRLKIGNGKDEFSALPYMSVDSFILPKTASVYIDPTKWQQADDERYYQVVTVQNAIITANSKVDLTPSAEQLDIFHEKDLAFVAENEDGIVSVFCIGQIPTHAYTIPVIITEVVIDG
jgi:hypothetical protein